MADSATLSIRLSSETKAQLGLLAAATGRSNSSLVAEAVAAFVARERPIDIKVESLQLAEILLDVWKFRAAHCWRLLQNYGLATVIVTVAPYIMPLELNQRLGSGIFIFFWLGLALAALTAWLFTGEYVRCNPYNVAFRNIVSQHLPEGETIWATPTLWNWLFLKIRLVFIVVLLFFGYAILAYYNFRFLGAMCRC